MTIDEVMELVENYAYEIVQWEVNERGQPGKLYEELKQAIEKYAREAYERAIDRYGRP